MARGRLAIWLSFTLLLGCQDPFGNRSEYVDLRGDVMGTTYRVRYAPANGITRKSVETTIAELFESLDKALSNWNPRSWVSRFNAARSTDPVPIPPHSREVLQRSLQLAELTNGALDPTIAPLIELWGFGATPAGAALPGEEAIAGVLRPGGYRQVKLSETGNLVVKESAGIQLNLSAVAKGYAVDALAARFEQMGVRNYLVDIGGEIRARGLNAKGKPWSVAIAQPTPGRTSTASVGAIQLNNLAIATSGDYHRFLKTEDQRRSHIIDPRTGHPVRNGVVSVSVTAPSCAQADGLATACMVMGLESGLNLVESLDGVEALFFTVGPDETLRPATSSGWNVPLTGDPDHDGSRSEP